MFDVAGETSDPYATFATFYDLEFGAIDDDLDMYREFGRKAGGPILELGCGTGRVLQALEQLDVDLCGIDNSPAMLRLARERLNPATGLVLGDFRQLSSLTLPGQPFWMIFSALNSFLHLLDVDAQCTTLAALHSVVVSGGILLLDLFNPAAEYLTQLDGRLQCEYSSSIDPSRRVDKWVSRTHDASAQLIETRVWYDVTGPENVVRRQSDSYLTRYIHRFELEHLLVRTGWTLVSLYGSYELDGFGPESDRMIALATPTNG